MSETIDRTREGGQQLFGYYYLSRPGSTPWALSGFDEVVTWADGMHGVKNRLHKFQIANHESATTSMSASEKRCTIKNGAATYMYTPQQKEYTSMGNLIAGPESTHFIDFDPVTRTAARELAEIRFINRYNALRSSFEAGVFGGEIRETIQFLRNPLKSFRGAINKYVDNARQRRWQKDRRFRYSRYKRYSELSRGEKRAVLGSLLDTWMEFRFAVRPLISDINSLCRTLDNQFEVFQNFGADSEVKSGSTFALADVQFGSSAMFSTQVVDKYWYQYACFGCISSRNGAGGRVKKDFGIMPEKFIPTVYELVPYSWLVDYFTNIGDIVNASCVNFADLAWYSGTSRSVGLRQRVGKAKDFNINLKLRGHSPTVQFWWNKEIDRSGQKPGAPKFHWSIPNSIAQYVDVGFLAAKRTIPDL